MKDRKHTLSMVEYEVRELRRLELITKEEFIRAIAIIRHELNCELSEG
jgi:putative cytoplasmic protein